MRAPCSAGAPLPPLWGLTRCRWAPGPQEQWTPRRVGALPHGTLRPLVASPRLVGEEELQPVPGQGHGAWGQGGRAGAGRGWARSQPSLPADSPSAQPGSIARALCLSVELGPRTSHASTPSPCHLLVGAPGRVGVVPSLGFLPAHGAPGLESRAGLEVGFVMWPLLGMLGAPR